MNTQAAMNADVVCVASWNADLVSRVQRPLARGETLMADAFEIGPGGKGSNASVACARQGASVAILARIGDDDFGRMGLELWRTESIDIRQVHTVPGERTGVAQILVYADGDNSIAVFPGATAGLTAHHAEQARPMLAACKVVMASCEVPLECTLAAFAIARESGARTVFNPAPARPLPDALLALVDVLTPNESELMALADLQPGAADRSTAAQRLRERGAGVIVVTLGASGCAVYLPDGTVREFVGHAMQVTDTIGAGDTFTGALAAAFARGETLEDAVRHANAAGALSVRGRGAIAGMPGLKETRMTLARAA